MNKKYLIKPGIVRSKSDGDRHYISFSKLIELYKVDRRECVNYENFSMRGFAARQYLAGLIVLEPREDGNYGTPQNNLMVSFAATSISKVLGAMYIFLGAMTR